MGKCLPLLDGKPMFNFSVIVSNEENQSLQSISMGVQSILIYPLISTILLSILLLIHPPPSISLSFHPSFLIHPSLSNLSFHHLSLHSSTPPSLSNIAFHWKQYIVFMEYQHENRWLDLCRYKEKTVFWIYGISSCKQEVRFMEYQYVNRRLDLWYIFM